MTLGIVGCSDIAFKRFMPAAKKIKDITVLAVAEEYDQRKLDPFCSEFNIEGMHDISALIKRSDIDAVYIPQPPALHYKWAKEALLNGKHVLIEKPSTDCLEKTKELVDIAKENNLALHENYMFQYHGQIKKILECLKEGEIGDVRLFRCSFGFPLRASNDFRYIKALGGGALLDAAGYTIKLASILLGETVKVDSAVLSSIDGYEVDMYGSAQLSNENGNVCQISFGMDCAYKCLLEVWGNKGCLIADRVFTAPEGFEPTIRIMLADKEKNIVLPADNHFVHSIEKFLEETKDKDSRNEMYREIVKQASLVEDVKKCTH